MRYFRYDGEFRWTGGSSRRIQVTVTDLETGKQHMPVLTPKNRAYSRFINYSRMITSTQTGFNFTCSSFKNDYIQSIANAKIYLDEAAFKEEFAEYLV